MLVWHDKELIEKVRQATEIATKKGAEAVARDAKKILMASAKKPTGKLASEIEIKVSKYKDGGHYVQAQGPGNYTKYYAIFVELGTRAMDALPYLRPALNKNKKKIVKHFERLIK